MSKNMAALWNKLESLQPVRRDVDPSQTQSNLDDRSSELPIVPDIGNQPEEWLSYTRWLRKQNLGFPDADSRHNFLCGAYDKAIKMMPAADNKRNVSYAIFLIEYAKLKREYSPDDTRALFNHARVYAWRFAIVHVAAGEFELQSAHPGKCKKILEKGRACDAQPSSMLQMALRRFIEGRSVLMTDEELGAYYRSVAGGGKSGSTSSQDSTGDLSFSGSIQGGRAPLIPLSNRQHGLIDHMLKGPAREKDSPSGHSIISFKAERDDVENHIDNRCVFEKEPSTKKTSDEPMEVTEANTAPNPVAEILGEKPYPRAPVLAPASCSKPPFRSYHSTPDVKKHKAETELKNHSQAAKWLPRRVKKLDLPLVTPEDESSEDDESSFNDIKPLDETAEPVISFESMDQSHPGLTVGHVSGHTSGYGSSISMTSHTRGYPTPGTEPRKVHRHSPILEVDSGGEGKNPPVLKIGTVPNVESVPCVKPVPCGPPTERGNSASGFGHRPASVSRMQSNSVHLSRGSCKSVLTTSKTNSVEQKPNLVCSAKLTSNSTYDLNQIVPNSSAIHSIADPKPTHVTNDPKAAISHCVPPVVAGRGGPLSKTRCQSAPSHTPLLQSAAPSLPRPQLQQMNRTTTLPSQPVFATPSQPGGVGHHISQPAPPVVMYTPNMKTIEEIVVNGKHYSVLRVVGRGGSSKVYQCFDFENKKSVGIKCVDLSDADDFVVQGYKNEITLLKRLQHSDKVIKMFDYEHNLERGCLYIVMELGDTDLASLFRNASKTKDITESLMKYYWEAMLKAVKVLHQEGIIHSDLKPANFLLVQGQLKLIDFGIANAIQQDRTSVMRETQVGTLNYMSPEAIMESCGELSGDGRLKPKYKIGVKCDVWSLGCILYNMVYGHTPFQLITKPFLKYQAIISPSHQIDFPDIADKHLLDVMKRCLIRDVKQRPTIDELLDHPYLNRTKAAAAPNSVQSLLVELQQAVANSPGKIKHLENVLNSFKGGSTEQGSNPPS